MEISVDNPGAVDSLARVPFARHLLKVAMSVEAGQGGVVIGLEGTWGSGKSHVLEKLPQLLEEEQEATRPLLIRFNPWMVSGTPGLVEALLFQIAGGLEEARRKGIGGVRFRPNRMRILLKLISNLSAYASLLRKVKDVSSAADAVLPGSGLAFRFISWFGQSFEWAGPMARRWLDRSEPVSLEARRQLIQKTIREFGIRLIVVLDDLDRLAPTDFAAMIQSIKAVANFPNIVYIAAHDPEISSELLETALKVQDGRMYLEKVIQIPMPLPQIPIRRMSGMARDRLRFPFESNAISSEGKADLSEALQLAAAMMETPRDIERLRSRLLVAAPILEDKINPADLLLLEALALKAPAIIDWIRRNVTAVIAPGISQYDTDIELFGLLSGRPVPALGLPEEEVRHKEMERAVGWREVLPRIRRSEVPIQNAMSFLFDKCIPKWSPKVERTEFRRVQRFPFWYQWECYHDHQDRWSVREIEEILRDPRSVTGLRLLDQQDQFQDFCRLICDYGPENLPGADALSFVGMMVAAERRFSTDFILDPDSGFGAQFALHTALQSQQKLEERIRALERLVAEASVWFSGKVLINVQAESVPGTGRTRPVERRIVPELEALAPLRNEWFNKADAHMRAATWTAPSSGYSPYTLLVFMKSLGRPEDQIKTKAREFIEDDAGRLTTFFTGFEDPGENDILPFSVRMDLLPDIGWLVGLAKQSPEFCSRYSRLLQLLEDSEHSQSADEVGGSD